MAAKLISTKRFTVYISGVWWGWLYTKHVRSWRWGVLYVGRIGICWSFPRG